MFIQHELIIVVLRLVSVAQMLAVRLGDVANTFHVRPDGQAEGLDMRQEHFRRALARALGQMMTPILERWDFCVGNIGEAGGITVAFHLTWTPRFTMSGDEG